jgi:peptide deformylase
MTLRKLALLGHPVLLTCAEPVVDLGHPSVQTLIDDMLATMIDADGIGLAAPQVYEPLRLIVALELQDRAERGTAVAHVLVNPELTPVGEVTELAFEGCLSIPDLRGRVPRHASVAYRALDRYGREVRGVATGLFARVLQHEVDHLDGVLYPMRMTDLRQLAFTGQLPHLSAWLEQHGELA